MGVVAEGGEYHGAMGRSSGGSVGEGRRCGQGVGMVGRPMGGRS